MALSALAVLLIILFVGWIFAQIANKIGLPRVVGQLLAGIVFGLPLIKSTLFTSDNQGFLSLLADIGAVLLFFYIGLQINLREVKGNFRTSAFISILNTTIPFITGFLACVYIFKLGVAASFIIGAALSVSAVAFSLDILEEMKLVRTKIGQLIVTAGTVDDIFELSLISIALALIENVAIGVTLQKLFLDVLVFFVLIILFRFVIIPWLLKVFEREHSVTSLFTGALLITLLVASLSEVLGLSSLIGALVAGIFIRQILLLGKKKGKLEEHTLANLFHIISFGFFVPIFFIWVGANVDLSEVIHNLNFGIVITIITIAGTVLGTMLAVRLGGGSWKDGHVVGWGVTAKGDTELVIATLALKSGVITAGIFSSLVFMAFVTTVTAPVMFRYLVSRMKVH